jgi:hypothetical protein
MSLSTGHVVFHTPSVLSDLALPDSKHEANSQGSHAVYKRLLVSTFRPDSYWASTLEM